MMARTAAFVLLWLLAACAAIEPSPAPKLSGVPEAFEVSARLSVRQGQRSEIARIRWTHRASRDLWVVASPLGNEVARIESDEAGARLSQGNGEEHSAPSFEALTERILGVALDPSALAAWLHGRVPPASPGGWEVTLDELQDAGAVQLARRLGARRGETVVRLVVDDYRVVDP